MCGSTVDIQSATAEIRRGIKKKKKQDKNITSASATQGGHKQETQLSQIKCAVCRIRSLYRGEYVRKPEAQRLQKDTRDAVCLCVQTIT